MSVCFCIDNSTLSRNISNGSRNNPADVHRTSRTSLQFHYNNRHNVPHPTPKHTDKVNTAPHTTTQELKTPSAQRSTSNTEAYRQKSTPHPTPQPKNSKLPRHNVPHPIPKHTDKSQQRSTHNNEELLPCPTGWEREGGRSGYGTLRSPSLALTALKMRPA